MPVYGVFATAPQQDGAALDRQLRERFAHVYRVGLEFWLIDTARDADTVAASVPKAATGERKVFVAAITRAFASTLSQAAAVWLSAPERSWGRSAAGFGGGALGNAMAAPYTKRAAGASAGPVKATGAERHPVRA